ncbi:MAG: hypothetical protein FJW40_13890 [Acidobacteria bacterium]|nr:hypothetical protein [Acidobacteriota bacterium]
MSSSKYLAAILALPVWASPAFASEDPRQALRIQLPPGAPVALVSSDWGDSRSASRGGALVVDLRTTLQFRNVSPNRIRAITLLVLAQEVTPGGKASVAVPSLDAAPGETFPVRLDLRLLRPVQAGPGALVEVSVDGILFDTLGFYGPNRLNSRRSMTLWEMEARRDRKHLHSILTAGGPDALRREMLENLNRQAEMPRLDVRMARGRATAASPGREVSLAFVRFPNAPVDAVSGAAIIASNEVRLPRVEVVNRTDRPVRSVEFGWILRDREGREYPAVSAPSATPVEAGAKATVTEERVLQFSSGQGQPLDVESLTGYVNSVEFADGNVWVPGRDAIGRSRVGHLVPASAEEQRLGDLYRRRGLNAVIEDLRRFHRE